jgi:hypothetical protein
LILGWCIKNLFWWCTLLHYSFQINRLSPFAGNYSLKAGNYLLLLFVPEVTLMAGEGCHQAIEWERQASTNQTWRATTSWDHHGASPQTLRHTTISQHATQQVHIVRIKKRKNSPIMPPHHLCIFICHSQNLQYVLTATKILLFKYATISAVNLTVVFFHPFGSLLA